MGALWFAPPGVLIAGSIAMALQLRRIASQQQRLAQAVAELESDRVGLERLRRATDEARASLEALERR